MVTSAVVTSGVPEYQEAIQPAVQILSSLQNPESHGFCQAQVDACIAKLSALLPVGASCSNVGASCSISEAAEATSTKADGEEAAEATSTKKADEDAEASCSNVDASCSISEAAEPANTVAAAVPEAANTAVHEEGIAAKSNKSRAKKAAPVGPRRTSPRLNPAAAAGGGASPMRKQVKRK
jgi:hypothetical protein